MQNNAGASLSFERIAADPPGQEWPRQPDQGRNASMAHVRMMVLYRRFV
jgi:hypothetical protein